MSNIINMYWENGLTIYTWAPIFLFCDICMSCINKLVVTLV